MHHDCRRQFFSTLMAILFLLPALGVQAQDSAPSGHGNYALKPVTPARLLNGTTDPSAWLMYGGNYQSWRFSPLTDINRENVKHLRAAWIFQTALQLKGAHIVATDIAETALAIARVNAADHGVADLIEFREGPGLDPLATEPGASYDLICSNPPYICDEEWIEVPANVKDHEPEIALRGGGDGLDVIRALIAGAGRLLRPEGRLVVEIADRHHDAVIGLVEATDTLTNPIVLKDHEGLWRVLVAERASSS